MDPFLLYCILYFSVLLLFLFTVLHILSYFVLPVSLFTLHVTIILVFCCLDFSYIGYSSILFWLCPFLALLALFLLSSLSFCFLCHYFVLLFGFIIYISCTVILYNIYLFIILYCFFLQFFVLIVHDKINLIHFITITIDTVIIYHSFIDVRPSTTAVYLGLWLISFYIIYW